MANISKGMTVRQVVKPIVGEVVKKEFDDDEDKFRYFVKWTDDQGESHERAFLEGEVEVVQEGEGA